MIAHLSGTLLSKQATSVILDVAGVGYEVTIPVSTFYELEEPGASVQLRIYTHVREDALQLYGFKTARERELFLRLISVSGIGPKLGINVAFRNERRRNDRIDSHQQPGSVDFDSRRRSEKLRSGW